MLGRYTKSKKLKAKNKKQKERVPLAEVVSAVPLAKEEESKIRSWVAKNVGRDVKFTTRVDPQVIAGIRVKAGDWLFDATFKGELERARNTLVGHG